MVKTTDDFYPNWPGDFVSVSLNFPSKKVYEYDTFRVSVWGEDDFGLEREFGSKEDATNYFNKICSLPIITIAQLKLDGFIGA